MRAGDLLWIPNLLDHATVNFGDEVVGLFNLINDLGDSPLHVASQTGDEAAVRGLLQAGHAGRRRRLMSMPFKPPQLLRLPHPSCR